MLLLYLENLGMFGQQTEEQASNWRTWWRKKEEDDELERLERLLNKQLGIIENLPVAVVGQEVKQIASEIPKIIFEQVDYDLYKGIYIDIRKSLLERKRYNLKIALLLLQ